MGMNRNGPRRIRAICHRAGTEAAIRARRHLARFFGCRTLDIRSGMIGIDRDDRECPPSAPDRLDPIGFVVA